MTSQAHLTFDLNELHDRSEETNPIDCKETVEALKAKLIKYPDLYALSAPQIGIKQRVIVLKYSNGIMKAYINPVILKADDYHLVREKDISIPEKEFISLRPKKVHIRYQCEDAKPEENFLYAPASEIFDRMVNYLDGVTLDELGLEVIPEFDEASDEEKQEVIDAYLQSLKKRNLLAQEAVEEDKDAKELMNAIRFEAGVEEGKVQLGHEKLDESKSTNEK